MIRYQDRIVYGTDSEVHDIQGNDPAQVMQNMQRGWQAQWNYLATDTVINQVKGLKLPKTVIDKIYNLNSESYFKPLTISK